jgi:DNA-binding XRE family transcriptional regulator
MTRVDVATVASLEAGRGTLGPLTAILSALECRFSWQRHGESLGKSVAAARKATALTQEKLGDLANLTRQTILAIEKDRGHLHSLIAVSNVLKLPSLLVMGEEATSSRPHVRVHVGDCGEILQRFPNGHFQTCITSPPYFRQRDYGVPEQIGWEATVDEYIVRLVGVMREVRRVLRNDGTLWLVIGDAFAQNSKTGGHRRKELIGIPWKLAFALRDDGWLLRQEVILNKLNPLPEPVKDRFARSHEVSSFW